MKKKRVLIVNCYIDEVRYPFRRASKIPQTMAPPFLAGLFSFRRCDIRLYDEMSSGPLENEALFSFPHMLVLTGLNTAFDRMLHVTAYARTRNKQVVVVAGGPAVRMLRRHSKKYFDYCCTGDIEQLAEIIRDVFGRQYVSEDYLENGWVTPRYDLTYWMKMMGYLESSRNCYFRCNFCSLTAESATYRKYDIRHIKRQLESLGRWRLIHFIDNNFATPDRQSLVDKLNLLKEFKERKCFWKWSALVTNEFFFNPDNLELARRSGCIGLFSGIESFEKETLKNFGKHQNLHISGIETIKRCLNAGIFFLYGLMFDVVNRPVSEFRDELHVILDSPEITLPSFLSLSVPVLGSPYFYECLINRRFMPNIKIRDMDTTTLIVKPLDPLPKLVKFIKEINTLASYKRKIARHGKNFYQRYKKTLSPMQMGVALYNMCLLCNFKPVTAGPQTIRALLDGNRCHHRTYIGATERLDAVYQPKFRVDSRYRSYFEPTMLTDPEGNLSEPLHLDLMRN